MAQSASRKQPLGATVSLPLPSSKRPPFIGADRLRVEVAARVEAEDFRKLTTAYGRDLAA
jgi:hypothetical protein